MACNLEELEAAACASGIGKIDDQTKLLQLIAASVCELASPTMPTICENLEGASSPLNAVTPDFAGQVYVQDGDIVWQAASLLSSSWTVICEPSPAEESGILVGPNPEVADSIDGQGDSFIGDRFPNTPYTTLSFGNPVTVTIDVDITACSLMTSLEFRLLTTVGGNLSIFSDALVSLSCPLLASIGQDVDVSSMATLTTLDLPSLSTVGDVNFIENTSLTVLNLPSLITVMGNFNAYGCTLLAQVSVPNFIPHEGIGMDISDCALNAASVEQILRRCVLAGVTTASINLSGGTSAGTASLNAQGQADVATLGAQLTINP